MKKIALIRGDGIGPKLINAAVKVVDAAALKHGFPITYEDVAMGGAAYDRFGTPIPQEELKKSLSSDAVLLGSVGGEKWRFLSGKLRPEAGVLELRNAMKLYASVRPVKVYPELAQSSPLSLRTLKDGFDVVFVNELSGGIYFGERGTRHGRLGREAYDTEVYSEIEIERILRVGFELAMQRKKKLASVDKADSLETGRLWRTVLAEVAADYPEVAVDCLLVENAAARLIKSPSSFDVIVSSNMFGNFLSDVAAALSGCADLLPSAELGRSTMGIYQPAMSHAEPLSGQDFANPVGMILSTALMFRHSFGREDIAQNIEAAVNCAVSFFAQLKTASPYGKVEPTTDAITDKVIEFL